ncbi:hypothetical protein D3C78_1621560 [compost metagenome]
MRNDRRIARLLSHTNGIEGFTETSDLVVLDQDRVPYTLLDPFTQNTSVGNKQIITH